MSTESPRNKATVLHVAWKDPHVHEFFILDTGALLYYCLTIVNQALCNCTKS